MKKAIFASILMLATLTACQNGETFDGENPILQKTSMMASSARTTEDLTPLQEKEYSEMALAYVKQERKDFTDGKEIDYDSSRRAVTCHTSYYSQVGHACATINGMTFYVEWHDDYGVGSQGSTMFTTYTSTHVVNCRC